MEDVKTSQPFGLTTLKCKRIFDFAFISGARENELGTNTPLIRALKYAMIGTITIHLMSCGWYSMACPNIGTDEEICEAGSWAVKLKTGR